MTDEEPVPPTELTAAGAGSVAAQSIGDGAIVQTGPYARAVRIEAGALVSSADLKAAGLRFRGRGARSRSVELESAADALAEALLDQWARTVRDRGLHPEPIPVRWSWHRRPPADSGPFEPLPGFTAADPSTVDGGTIDDFFQVYAGARAGRVVLLGDGGAGKSDVAAWTVVQALRLRERLDDDERARFPVPVLLTVAEWDHERQLLDDWLADEVEKRYKFLRRGKFGRGAARRLLRGDRMAFFLDGFDEMAEEPRRAALEQIDRRAMYRVMIFSRIDEFEGVRAGQLRGAAELKLLPVNPDVVTAYFRRCQGEPAPEPWERLIAHLRERPDGFLASALNSPLMVTLVRDVFPDAADVRGLVQEPFATRDDVEGYLLDRLVNVAYRASPGPSIDTYELMNARRWLGHLATGMDARGTYSLDWRNLPRWAPAAPRVGVIAAVTSLAGAVGGAICFGPGEYVITTLDLAGPWDGTVFGATLGLVLGTAGGVAAELRDPESSWLFGRGGRQRPKANLGAGLGFGAFIWLTYCQFFFQTMGNKPLAATLAVFCAACAGGVAGVAAARVHPIPGHTRRARWKLRYSRAPLVPALVAAGVPAGLLYGFHDGFGQFHLVAGLLNALWATLLVAFGIGALRQTAQLDPLTGREAAWKQEIRRTIAFGMLFGVIFGLGYGLRWIFQPNFASQSFGWEHRITSGLFQAVGLAIPFGVGAAIFISDAWRSTLLFFQLYLRGTFPVRGMRFLEDAYNRRILRAEGPRYQFRHARLQDKLAREAAT